MHRQSSPLVSFKRLVVQRARRLVSKRISRRLVCVLIVLGLPIWPGGFSLPQLNALASTSVDFAGVPLGYLPLLVRSVLWLTSSAQRPDKLADRLAQVRTIQISPARFVAYPSGSLTFSAVGKNFANQTIEGLVFNWESSDPATILIDEAGRATFIAPGLTIITCRAGAAVAIARVLVRSGARPRQTDDEWRADQDTLIGDGRPAIDDSALDTVGSALSSMLDKLAPTVCAQGGGYSGTDFGFDELWSAPANLVGSPRNRAIEPTRLGSVLPEGSNSSFAVPLVALGGRGLGAGLTLFYNSRVWSRQEKAVTFSAVGGFPFAGFSLGFGRILTYGPTSNTKLVLVDPDGTLHYLGSGNAYTTGTYQTSDGTHITYVGSAAYGGSLYYNDGTKVTYNLYNNRLLPVQIQDSNGNYAQIAYKYGVASPLAIDVVTDTQGRQIHFNYDAGGKLISITAPGYGGTAENPVTRTVAQFDYQSRTLSYNFSELSVENAPSGTVNVLRHIRFAGTSTGWLYSYSDYGMIYNVSARRQMTIDGNGVISDGVESASVAFNYPTSGSTVLSDAPAFTQRTESATNSPTGVYTYSTTEDNVALTKTFTVTRPDTSTLNLTRSTNAALPANGLLVQSEIKNTSGASMSKAVTTHANDPGGSVQAQSIIAYDDINKAKFDFDYDAYGNVTNKREYGFQIGGAWQVRRRTNFTYLMAANYINNYLRSLVAEVKVYDALENTNDTDDVLIAKTAYVYDDYTVTGGMNDYGCCGGGCLCPDSPGHNNSYNSSYTVRGNVTGTTQWIDIAANTMLPTRLKQYDMFGNVLREMVSCCNQKVFTYVEDDYWANPPTVTDGYPQGLHLTGSTTYDFNTGLPMYTSHANLGTTSFYYDAALRLIRRDLPTLESDTASYNDAAMTASFTKAGLGTTTITYDGFGRALQTLAPNNGQVNTTYDAMGRLSSRTNPFPAGGTPGPATTFQYDALGRATITTLPGGNTVQNLYSGTTMTATDQVNRKIRRETDGLGRLIKVIEQDSNGSLTQETNYSYNLLDKVSLVNQGNQARSLKYDAFGRLLYERIPEHAATINDGSGTYWTTKFTYTDFNMIATRTDGRGVIKSYSYDSMNRPISISYNTASAPGVAATASIALSYDNDNSSATNGLLLNASVTNPETLELVYRETYTYNDTYKRLSSITREFEGRSYITSYQYGAGSLRSRITYPSGRVMNINRDSVGRIDSLTDSSSVPYVSGVSYNAVGQVTGMTLGNGVAETYGYDANRLQLNTQSATKSGGPQNGLMNLIFSHQASAGQMGASTTAGNADQLISVSGTINGTTESAAYEYDNLGRLVTSNQNSNGSSAQRRFAYDRWGNRTGVWNAVSGGAQIQSVVLQQSGGVPTNRLISVTNNGSTVNYTYDATGNVTNDGVHSYQYDAENRIVTIDGGATAQYGYDHQNRRYKKILGSVVIHYAWEGSQVIAEYDANSGVVSVEYIYSKRRLIAKISASATQYFLSDWLSARIALDAAGNGIGRQGHLPFGEDFAESGTQDKHHLTNYERDAESGTDYAVNRQYSQSAGRFMSVDPILGSIGDPPSLNRYAYVRNDSVNAIDPLGLETTTYPGSLLCWILPWFCEPQPPSETRKDEEGRGGGGFPIQFPSGKPKLKYISTFGYVIQFFIDNPHCVEEFTRLGIYDDFLKTAQNARWVDFRDPENLQWAYLKFRELGLRSNEFKNDRPFPKLWGITIALSWWEEQVVTIGQAFYDQAYPQQLSTVVHEDLHLFFRRGHADIARKLELGDFGKDEYGASRAIDNWLESNCHR